MASSCFGEASKASSKPKSIRKVTKSEFNTITKGGTLNDGAAAKSRGELISSIRID